MPTILNFFLNAPLLIIRYMKPMLMTGWKRPLGDDDIYAVTNSLRSEKNTEEFAKLWDMELKKPNPSILRVILKLYALKVFTLATLFLIGESFAK